MTETRAADHETDDIGRPFHDLDVARRPIHLTEHIAQAYSESHRVVLRDVSRTANEELQSANEELETMNEELPGRAEQIDYGEQFLALILRVRRLSDTLDSAANFLSLMDPWPEGA